MLFASTIRSPFHRGRNAKVGIDALPKGYSAILAEDLPRHSLFPSFKDGIPIFASEQISYRGEALGLILGPDPGSCDELAAAARVECEEEEPEQGWESFSSSQIAYHTAPNTAIWKKCSSPRPPSLKRSIETAFSTIIQRTDGRPILLDKETLSVHCATQWPDDLRRRLSGALSLSEADIVVHPTEMGRTLDGRLWYPTIVAAQPRRLQR
jgi:CO/xanthine dehydrogenase Mo-binding subunit